MRFVTLVFTALVLAVVNVQCVHAESLSQSNIEDQVFRSEIVVTASLIENNTVQVNEVLMGSATVGQKLKVERLLDLSRQKFDDENEANTFMWRNGPAQTKTAPPEVDGTLLLFLGKDDRRRWTTQGWGSGVKWLVDGKVFGYRQLMNPGDYVLLPDREAKTEVELRKLIQEALIKKLRYMTALSIEEPDKRVRELSVFVQPEEKSYLYFYAALGAITKAGAVAGPFLRLQVERSEQKSHRSDFLTAFGRSHDPDAVPYLLELVKHVAPIIKARVPFRWTALSETEKLAIADWGTAIYVLADIGDKRAVPAFRDALLWGAENWAENRILEPAARGLQKLPNPDNVPFFAQALSSIPKSEYDWVAVYDCVLALKEHHYKATVPVLANQLKYPDKSEPQYDSKEYNARVAHRALVDIVGKDLGGNKEPWLKWFAAQQK